MKYFYSVRKIDELGRVVIPIEVRNKLNIKEKDPLEISIVDDGIFIIKNTLSCIFCNSSIDLKNYKGKNICKKCLNNLYKINE